MTNSLKDKQQKNFKLPDQLEMGAVELNVKNLAKISKFYRESLLFELISEDSEKAILGYEGKTLLILNEIKGVEPKEGSAGLYHTAFVFEKQSHLANVLKNLFNSSPLSYTGSGDHTVSEAFYLNDPEGNGVELYYDRNRVLWSWDNGQINMGTKYIDEMQYIIKFAGDEKGTLKVGHVHLKVGNIEKARDFYVDVLGFDITFGLIPSALFVSAGGYHHHLGMNVWESEDAEPRDEKEYGLRSFEVVLNDSDLFDKLKNKIENAGVEIIEIDSERFKMKDPWNNEIQVTA